MGLDHFFSKDLVFCLEADNQEQLFDQVAPYWKKRKLLRIPIDRLCMNVKNVPNRFRYGISREGLAKRSNPSHRYDS